MQVSLIVFKPDGVEEALIQHVTDAGVTDRVQSRCMEVLLQMCDADCVQARCMEVLLWVCETF